AVGFSVQHQHHVVPKPATTQSAASADMGADVPAYRALPTVPARASPMARPAVSRHPLKVRAVCLSRACTDPCGGRGVIPVPTAIAKSGKSLTRFFPEVVVNLRAMPLDPFVIDGELVIEIGKVPDFNALQMRLHPAESRIRRLASVPPATPAPFACLLRQLDKPLLARPFSDRRRALEAVAADMGEGTGLRVTSFTHESRTAKRWLNRRHKSLDGVVSKRLDLAYLPGARAMLKVKCL